MTLARQIRHKAHVKRLTVERLEREGRLIPATSCCGPWERLDGGGERCLKCGCVDFDLFPDEDD